MAKYMVVASQAPHVKALISTPSAGGGVTNVLKEADGDVTLLDKFKKYYKLAITAVGTLLLVLNTITPVFEFLPIDQKWMSIIIAGLTTVSVFLKRNETWVEEL